MSEFIQLGKEDDLGLEELVEQKLVIRSALQRLTDRQRALVELYYFYNFTQEELAGIFDNVPNTIGRQISVALDTLKQFIEQEVAGV